MCWPSVILITLTEKRRAYSSFWPILLISSSNSNVKKHYCKCQRRIQCSWIQHVRVFPGKPSCMCVVRGLLCRSLLSMSSVFLCVHIVRVKFRQYHPPTHALFGCVHTGCVCVSLCVFVVSLNPWIQNECWRPPTQCLQVSVQLNSRAGLSTKSCGTICTTRMPKYEFTWRQINMRPLAGINLDKCAKK